jgi:chromosome condensin MukBEF ATPase and DNA-binding subunit MukB
MTKKQLTTLNRIVPRTNKLRLAVKELAESVHRQSDLDELREAEALIRKGQATLAVLQGACKAGI